MLAEPGSGKKISQRVINNYFNFLKNVSCKAMYSLRLRHKINAAIIATFVLIAIIFGSIQLTFQHQRYQIIISKIEALLQTLVKGEQDLLVDEIIDNRLRAIKIRLKQMLNVKGMIAINVFDHSGRLLAFAGSLSTALNPSSSMLKFIMISIYFYLFVCFERLLQLPQTRR